MANPLFDYAKDNKDDIGSTPPDEKLAETSGKSSRVITWTVLGISVISFAVYLGFWPKNSAMDSESGRRGLCGYAQGIAVVIGNLREQGVQPDQLVSIMIEAKLLNVLGDDLDSMRFLNGLARQILSAEQYYSRDELPLYANQACRDALGIPRG